MVSPASCNKIIIGLSFLVDGEPPKILNLVMLNFNKMDINGLYSIDARLSSTSVRLRALH
jgi:hypothetical protein